MQQPGNLHAATQPGDVIVAAARDRLLGHALDVTAGTEGTACTRQNDRADGRIAGEARQRLEQPVHNRRRERVEPVRPVQRQRRHAVRERLDQLLVHAGSSSTGYLTCAGAHCPSCRRRALWPHNIQEAGHA